MAVDERLRLWRAVKRAVSDAAPMANLCRYGRRFAPAKYLSCCCLFAFLGIHTRENECSLELTTTTAAGSLTINRNVEILRNHEHASE